jgi:hypothetical protein
LKFRIQLSGGDLNEIVAAVDMKQVVVSVDRVTPTYRLALKPMAEASNSIAA